jgi:formylglycine-generating enzyme required for sulfatase activity
VREWERAARGADGRSYPHGEKLEATDANVDITYDRKELARGPDEVGSFPGSDSPFGVSDLAGNVWDMVVGPPTAAHPTGEPWMKGGSWYHGIITALATNRNIGDPKLRDLRQGLRICTSATPAR